MTQDKSRTQVAKLCPPISAFCLNHPSSLETCWTELERSGELLHKKALKQTFKITSQPILNYAEARS